MTPLPTELASLSVAERIALAQALWESVSDEERASRLSEVKRAELERRALEDDADPQDVIPWERASDVLSRRDKTF